MRCLLASGPYNAASHARAHVTRSSAGAGSNYLPSQALVQSFAVRRNYLKSCLSLQYVDRRARSSAIARLSTHQKAPDPRRTLVFSDVGAGFSTEIKEEMVAYLSKLS